MERHDQRQAVSRSALRRLRLLLPAGDQQPAQLLLARHRPPPSSVGAHQVQQLDRDRKQYNLAATYFLDTGSGSHTFKIGGEMLEGAVVGRSVFAPRRHEQHRARLRQRRVEPGDLRPADRDLRGRQPRRARLPDLEVGARSHERVPQRHVVGRPHDAQPRRALGPLQRLEPRAGSDRRPRVGPRVGAAASTSTKRTSTPGTCSRRAPAWCSTSPATARPCSRATTASTGTTPASASRRTPTRTSPASRRLTAGTIWRLCRLHQRRQPLAAR